MSDNLDETIGYHSLRHEMHVRALLAKLKWRATHGPYYVDPREGKEREIDVSATRTWTTKRGITAHVTLLVECKSARDGAQLLAQTKSDGGDPLYYEWLGDDDRRVRRAIGDKVEDRRLMERFHKLAYPRERALVTSVLVDAPKAPFRAAATREPNGKESGPMWDATQKVFSAMRGTILTENAETLDQMLQDLDSVRDDLKDAEWVMRRAIDTVMLFHPIVSIESPLQLVDESGKMKTVPWCRLERGRVFGGHRDWIDVVNAGAFKSYAAETTAWYDRVLGRTAAK